jgi:hypothetical protein
LSLAACGRLSFEPTIAHDDAATGVQDAEPDADPAPIGCSDGTRDGLLGLPKVAACHATWAGNVDLRAASTGTPCGGGTPCTVPADACETGWHICGIAGDPTEISSRLSVADCNTTAGRFVAGLSHCTSGSGCMVTPPLPCTATATSCTEPVCCGTTCDTVNVCKDGVYAGQTRIVSTGMYMPMCGAMQSGVVDGVLCCR